MKDAPQLAKSEVAVEQMRLYSLTRFNSGVLEIARGRAGGGLLRMTDFTALGEDSISETRRHDIGKRVEVYTNLLVRDHNEQLAREVEWFAAQEFPDIREEAEREVTEGTGEGARALWYIIAADVYDYASTHKMMPTVSEINHARQTLSEDQENIELALLKRGLFDVPVVVKSAPVPAPSLPPEPQLVTIGRPYRDELLEAMEHDPFSDQAKRARLADAHGLNLPLESTTGDSEK